MKWIGQDKAFGQFRLAVERVNVAVVAGLKEDCFPIP
jgi:hypothetical protein